MPTTSLNIAANADNGGASGQVVSITHTGAVGVSYIGTSSPNPLFTSFAANHKKLVNTAINIGTPTASPPGTFSGNDFNGSWLRFTGLTIPFESTVNSATLSVYGVDANVGATMPVIKLNLDSREVPGNPSTVKQVFSPANLVSGTPTLSITQTGNAVSKAAYVIHNVSVLSQIQSLVNLYDYSNGEVVIYANSQNAGQDGLALYVKKGGASKEPKLVINFTAPVPTDKTTYKFV